MDSRRPLNRIVRRLFLMGIDKYAEQLGTPDIKLSGLQIWVHGRQFPNATDYWDGNWLRIHRPLWHTWGRRLDNRIDPSCSGHRAVACRSRATQSITVRRSQSRSTRARVAREIGRYPTWTYFNGG